MCNYFVFDVWVYVNFYIEFDVFIVLNVGDFY